MSSAANIRSICIRPFAWSMRKPRPALEPTHSPTTAPMGATAVATRTPEASAGSAAGTRMRHSVRHGRAPMARARSSQPGSVRRRPSKKLAATGK